MRSFCNCLAVVTAVSLATSSARGQAPQRVLGLDISYWNNGTSSTGTSQANWNTAFNTPNANGYTRQFAWVRASRGGTTGVDRPQGTPWPGNDGASTFSRRYDDPRFVQNITRATTAGMLTGPYHFGRPDIAGNTGTDEANHFIQAAGAWMRPGYLLPVFDLEAGTSNLGQFSLDFSNRLYAVTGIRPGMYINGNHTNHLVNSSNPAQLAAMAQPAANGPSMVGPAYPMLWNARYANQDAPESIPVQTGNPRTTPSTSSGYYGPWDDYGDSQPWAFWQYASTVSIPGLNAVDATVDGNVSQGDIEFVRNYLVPAVWTNNSSGDWSAMANWNSGQAAVAPVVGPGQATPYMTGNLPTPRLPGDAGSGPTSGQYDTVILERPSANITVTVSTGSHNVRKLYMRETLNISGGSLSINYDPTYRPDTSSTVRHGGPLSAQFSGSVSLSGSGALSVHTLQVDASRTFTTTGGTLAFNRINLMPHALTPAKILVDGDVAFNSLGGAAAVIANGSGAGSSGRIDLAGGTRAFNVGNGAAATDVTISVPIINGGLTKTGAGTLALTGANSYAGDTTVHAGMLSLGSAFLSNSADVFVTSGATLQLNFGGTDVIDSLFVDGVSLSAGVWGAEGSGAPFTSSLIAGSGRLEVSTYVAPIPGDFNGDGYVDGLDLAAWSGNYGATPGADVESGDATGDGMVDGADFLVWQRNVTSSGAVAASAAVPEPAAWLLGALAGATIVAVRRRR